MCPRTGEGIPNFIKILCLGLFLSCLSISSASGSSAATTSSVSSSRTMDPKVREKILERVLRDQPDWRRSQIEINSEDSLGRPACSFFSVRYTGRMLSSVFNYAVLSNGAVIGTSDDNSAGKILASCASHAPARWWAEIVTRFHRDLGSGLVLVDEKQNRGATSKIEAEQKKFVPPSLTETGGVKSVTFYLLEPEAFVVYSVKATHNRDGTVTVVK